MINFINQTNTIIEIDIIEFLNKIKNDICKNDLELLIVNDDEIKELNKKFLNKNYVTDVLSFGTDYSNINILNPPLGSIVISIDKAIEMSNKYKHTLRDELAILFVHSLLHLLGYDHEVDNGEHRRKEIEILKKYNILNPLILRSLQTCK